MADDDSGAVDDWTGWEPERIGGLVDQGGPILVDAPFAAPFVTCGASLCSATPRDAGLEGDFGVGEAEPA